MAEYAETAVLVAVMDEDHEHADALLADFLPGELNDLAAACYGVLDRIRQARENATADERIASKLDRDGA